MKMLTAIIMLVFIASAFASSETKTFVYDGSQESITLDLRAEKTHTEYRIEYRQSICYRQDVFHRTVCRNTPRGPICQTVPHYRTVAYPCTQAYRIPYEVKDYDVEAHVSLSMAKLSEAATPGETFKATLNGDQLSLSAIGSKKFFIQLKKQNVTSQMAGSVKLIDATYAVEFIEAAPVLNALNVSDLAIKDSTLSFKTGPVEVPQLIGHSLKVKKSRLFQSSKVLFDRELATSEIMVDSANDVTSATVNMESLGLTFKEGSYKITAKIFYKNQGTLLNASQFEKLNASKTLSHKVR